MPDCTALIHPRRKSTCPRHSVWGERQEECRSNRHVCQTSSPEFEVGNGKTSTHTQKSLELLVGHSHGRLDNSNQVGCTLRAQGVMQLHATLRRVLRSFARMLCRRLWDRFLKGVSQWALEEGSGLSKDKKTSVSGEHDRLCMCPRLVSVTLYVGSQLSPSPLWSCKLVSASKLHEREG